MMPTRDLSQLPTREVEQDARPKLSGIDAPFTVLVLLLLVIDVNNNLKNANTVCGYTVTPATFASTYSGWTIVTDKTKAVQGETVTVTITSDGTGTETKAATAVTGGSVTVGDVTLTASTAASYDITFNVGNAAPGAVTVTLS